MSSSKRAFNLIRTLGSVAARAGAESVLRKLGAGGEPGASSGAAERLARGLDEMKGAAMKVGQLLSLHDDSFLPPGWRGALTRLQGSATARPWSEMRPVLIKAFGPELAPFASIEETATHAASISQVHRAVLKEGALPVAVKIRYPGLEGSVRADLDNLSRALKLAGVLPRDGNFEEIFKSVEEVLSRELDFEREADFTERFARAFAGNEGVRVPKVCRSACADGVLTTTWLDGAPISAWADAHAGPAYAPLRNRVGTRLLGQLFEELFTLRMIQSDPNPGNYLVLEGGAIGLLDFGASVELEAGFVEDYRAFFRAAVNGDDAGMEAAALTLGFLNPEDSAESRAALAKLMRIVAEPFRSGLYDWAGCGMFARAKEEGVKLAFSTRLRPPPARAVFLNRRVLGTQLLLERLGCRIDARAIAARFI